MILRQLVSEKIPPSRATPKSHRRAWVGGLIVGLLAAAVLLRTEPLGVTSELSRVARFLGNYFALLPERMEGLDAIRGCASRPGKVCSREDFFLYAPSSLVRWGLHSWRASLNSNGLRPRGLFWHSWEAYFWVGEQWSPLAVRSARCFRGFTPHRFRAGSARWDSLWLARAEKIPQEEQTVSLTKTVNEGAFAWQWTAGRCPPTDEHDLPA